MTAKHTSREYKNNARLIRQRVRSAWRLGEPVACWRGGGEILPGQHFDVGHLDPAGGEGLGNLAAEHRHRVAGCCRGNRSEGGALGAQRARARRQPAEVQSWPL